MNDITSMSDLMFREEALHEDLLDSICEGPLGMMIKHPLVFSLTYMEGRCGLINAQYAQKTKMLEEALDSENYQRAICLYERPYRVDALMEYINDYGFEQHPDFWEAVGFVWTDSENIYQMQEAWNYIWRSEAPERHKVMTDEEQTFLNDLQDEFTIFRGVQTGGTNMGMSWTINFDKAVWFSKRYQKRGAVLSATVNKENVLAYFGGRGESEIVIFPEMAHCVRVG